MREVPSSCSSVANESARSENYSIASGLWKMRMAKMRCMTKPLARAFRLNISIKGRSARRTNILSSSKRKASLTHRRHFKTRKCPLQSLNGSLRSIDSRVRGKSWFNGQLAGLAEAKCYQTILARLPAPSITTQSTKVWLMLHPSYNINHLHWLKTWIIKVWRRINRLWNGSSCLRSSSNRRDKRIHASPSRDSNHCVITWLLGNLWQDLLALTGQEARQ